MVAALSMGLVSSDVVGRFTAIRSALVSLQNNRKQLMEASSSALILRAVIKNQLMLLMLSRLLNMLNMLNMPRLLKLLNLFTSPRLPTRGTAEPKPLLICHKYHCYHLAEQTPLICCAGSPFPAECRELYMAFTWKDPWKLAK